MQKGKVDFSSIKDCSPSLARGRVVKYETTKGHLSQRLYSYRLLNLYCEIFGKSSYGKGYWIYVVKYSERGYMAKDARACECVSAI